MSVINFPLLPAPGQYLELAVVETDDTRFVFDLEEDGFTQLTEVYDPQGESDCQGVVAISVTQFLTIADRLRARLGISTIADAERIDRMLAAQRAGMETLPHEGMVS